MSIDISPSPDELIGEMERDGFTWAKALAEMIDNAFDEGAKRIAIRSQSKAISVEDDGRGCPSPENMLRKGYSTKRRSKDRIGRYGVGLKHASFYVCGTVGDTHICTVHGGMLRMVVANWGTMIASGRWAIDDPISEAASRESCASVEMSGETGTLIKFTNTKRSLPSGKNLDPILEELAFMFSPALERGLQIVIESSGKRRVLEPPQSPEWVESIDRTISVNGKKARIRAGIIPPNKHGRRRGLSYYFMHRVIVANSGHGCTGYPISHIAGTVELEHSWKLGQNKATVSDDDWDALGEAVLEEMRPMLEKASQQASHVASSKLRTDLEAIINEQLGRARRPNRNVSEGAKEPRWTARTVKRAAVVSGNGIVRGMRERTCGRIEVEFINTPDEGLFSVDITSNRVLLNQHWDFIRNVQSNDNKEALAAIVVLAFIQALVAANSFRVLPTMENIDAENRFADAATQILGGISMDNRTLAAAS